MNELEPDEGPDLPRAARLRTRTRWILAGVGLAVAGAVAIGIPLVIAPADPPPADPELAEEEEAPPPPPLELTMPTPAPLGDEAAATDAVVTAAETLVSATNEVLQRADGGFEGIESVATGFVEGELQALAIERERMGYRQVGEASVTGVTIRSIDLTASPPVALLEVCIDTSDLDVVDSNGTSVADQLYRPDRPVLHLYGAVFIDGLWRLSTHEIPDGATCA
jgi:hypothetical protein